MLTQTVPGGGDGPALKVSETIMRNVRVLATDQRITEQGQGRQAVAKTFHNVTLEVTPRIAEKMAVAQSLGTLSLSLRSIADNTAELERAVASGDIKVPANADPAQEKQMLLAIANRPIDTNTTYSTGGDVSRFQRRTVPARPAEAPSASCRRRRLPARARRRPTPARSSGSRAATTSPSFPWELAKMNTRKTISRARLGTAFAALALATGTIGAAAPAAAQSHAARPSETLNLSQNTGTLVRLSEPMTDVFVANESIADVQVRSPTQLYVFGKGSGETTVYATSKSGHVVYAANVRVANNVGSLNEMLHLAMPEAMIQATPMNNLVLLTGTVASPDDIDVAQHLVESYVGERPQRGQPPQDGDPAAGHAQGPHRRNEPLRDQADRRQPAQPRHGSTSLFGIGQGNPGTIDVATGPKDPITGCHPETVTGATFNNLIGGTTLGLFGHILGTDLLGTLDLLQKDGVVTTLAEPNLTALSGETASFLAGGEFPVPISQSLGAVTIEYKQYGVGLAFTPIVLADGRISLRVRPEVSELSNEGSVKLNNFLVPALTTRRAETTVELGSGQSFMIAGLLRKHDTNDVTKAPFLGDLPILGALFRSTAYRRDETELVIIVTPYLVRPVSTQIALPTDGYRAPDDAKEWGMGQSYPGTNKVTPTAVQGPPVTATVPAAAAAAPGFKL